MATLLSRLIEVVTANAQRIAMVDGTRHATYCMFLAQAHACAAALRARGLNAGDRVAIVLPNRLEAATTVYGIWLAGGVAVPLNAQARARDFAPWLRHCGARIVVHERDHADIGQALQEADLDVQPLSLDRDTGYPEAVFEQHHDPAPETLALLLYTSGTTGAPKGVMLSHANLLANAEAVIDYLQLTADDSVLDVLPFYYAYGASVLHTHLLCGARIVLAPSMMFPHLVMQALQSECVTGFCGVPSTYALLLAHVSLADLNVPTLRYLTQAGGAMPAALVRRLRDALPHARLFLMYGQTEATSRLTYLPPEQLDAHPGCVGRPLRDVEIRIRREDGAWAGACEAGEVCARGPSIMLGYWNNPEATSAALREGWLHTGDLGHLDAEGYLYLDGRRSDIIKTGAHRVNPVDIEEAITELPWVIEAAVVGVDDDILGQVIKAFVVVAQEQPRGEDRIRAHCRARLAPYKVPKHVQFIGTLPRTASGKVRRVQLTELEPS
jgi:acyl-CoA synthetase (AMP-forming)/AMP-acid ligase II